MPLAQIAFRDGLEQAWTDIAQFIPKAAAALAIVVVGWIVARIIRKVVTRLLWRVGFDDVMQRTGLAEPLGRAGYSDSTALVAKVVGFAVLLFALHMAVGVFGDTAAAEATADLVGLLPRLLVAGIIVVITAMVARFVRDLVAPPDATDERQRLGGRIAAMVVWFVGAVAAIEHVGVAPNVTRTVFTTMVGAAALIAVISLGVGGIWAARDRFWPGVYDRLSGTIDLAERERRTERRAPARPDAEHVTH